MPFTLSHPALVLPLHRRAGAATSLSALVIGSMMPDLPYFLLTGASGDFSHTLLGIALYCVPVGALVYLLYHALLRQPLVDWAPRAIAARMPAQVAWQVRDGRALAVVLASLAIGAASHLLWDAFTHAHTVVWDHLPLMRSRVSIGGHPVPLVHVLQHLSSLVGFVVIAAHIARWLARTAPAAVDNRRSSPRRRWAVLVAVLGASAVGGLVGLLFRQADSVERVLFNVVVTGMAMAALTLVALCVGWRCSSSRRS